MSADGYLLQHTETRISGVRLLPSSLRPFYTKRLLRKEYEIQRRRRGRVLFSSSVSLCELLCPSSVFLRLSTRFLACLRAWADLLLSSSASFVLSLLSALVQIQLQRLDQNRQRQQELLYSVEFQSQLMQRKVARVSGYCNTAEKKEFDQKIEKLEKVRRRRRTRRTRMSLGFSLSLSSFVFLLFVSFPAVSFLETSSPPFFAFSWVYLHPTNGHPSE